MTSSEIEEVVLSAIRNVNLARKPEVQLAVSPDAPVFGAGSPLDSLGLVSLIIDIEEALLESGVTVTLSDSRAMSQTRSPFRSVQALVAYIHEAMHSPS